MAIVDTHLHLVYPERFSYPWLSGAPAINKPWTAEGYFAEAEALGIEAALHMEVDVAEEDIEAETRFMTRVHPKVVGAIAAGRPESADFPEWLEIANTIGGVKAIRRILHTSPNELSQTSLFAENVRRLQAYDMAFDLCVRADQLLPVGKPLIEKAPHACRMARGNHGDRGATECRVQGFGDHRLWRVQSDHGDAPPLFRACHRELRLGARRLGQRLSGLHADRQPHPMGRHHQ